MAEEHLNNNPPNSNPQGESCLTYTTEIPFEDGNTARNIKKEIIENTMHKDLQYEETLPQGETESNYNMPIDNNEYNVSINHDHYEPVQTNCHIEVGLSEFGTGELDPKIVRTVSVDSVKEEICIEMKEELTLDNNSSEASMVSYEMPLYGPESEADDTNMKGSFQNEFQVKSEVDDCSEYEARHQDVKFDPASIKTEDTMYATETQMITKKIISSHSMHSPVPCSEPQVTRTVVMEILPMSLVAGSSGFSEMGGDPEESILPTSDHLTDSCRMMQPYPDPSLPYDPNEASFHLNSITGNMLSLEQEAYGLLEAKQRTKGDYVFCCSKCPKMYKSKHSLSMHLKVHKNSLRAFGISQEMSGLLEAKSKASLNCTISCPKCPKMYKSNHSLGIHLKVHDTVERRALGVLRGLEKKKQKRLKKLQGSKDNDSNASYYYNVVSGKGNFKCSFCGKAYILQGCLSRHQNSCTALPVKTEDMKMEDDVKPKIKIEPRIKKEGTEYVCECGSIFYRRSRMETCLRSHNPVAESKCISCSICAKPFKDKTELFLHRKNLHTKKKFSCKFCPTDYHTPKELFKHLRVHQKVQLMEYKVITEVVTGKGKLICFICGKTLTEISELKAHIMCDHKEPYTCPHCLSNFPKIVDFATHTKSDHPEIGGQSVLDVLEAFSELAQAWKCDECNVQFEHPDKLAIHQADQHKASSKTKKQDSPDAEKLHFQCEDCRRVFVTQKQLTTHRRLHHTSDTTDEVEANRNSDTSRTLSHKPPLPMCMHCRKTCKDEAALTSHMRFHSVDRKYACKYCALRFSTLGKRRAHESIHTGDMRYVCFICEYRCSSGNRLNSHKQSQKHIHMTNVLRSGLSVAVVPPCTETVMAQVSPEQDSEGSRESSEVASATCDVCGEEFPTDAEMSEHKMTHPFIEFPNDDQPSRIFFK